ncbi:hypothetical protein MTP99_019220 [Tenebrio molitor]|jgi:hypothetical protein|uniref:BZIP domain-containing protein n=1 Tax=Tenebrio molitor TaxID=7067 RepID=A0A8J6HRW1_TENMO|nr:hypothetical protein GEV33_002230 [Tenebrio molitor]KAJ3622954.1 hypothetical protein MTP99_019220 [Tenebrio molitor]
MFNPDLSQIFKPDDGRYGEMENVDALLNYENNEFMSSDFFDTIRSVESGIQDDFLNNSTDDFNTSSDTSSHIDGYTSPGNDASESERSSIFTDESVSPLRTVDAIDDSLFDFLQPVQNNFELETTPVIINSPKPRTKIIIQNPNKKIVNKPIVNTPIKKIGKKQILKVQSLTTNGKPVILPYGLKSIKILNASELKTDRIHVTTLPTSSVCRRKVEPTRLKDEADTTVPINELTEVKLTSEEKRLLDKEGIQLPAYHPLTKLEDRELKRIRRKIRNKISAQDSRKRKKEYVDGLEERVRRGSEENRNLMQRVKELQKKNKTLMAHINKLQSLIFNSTSSKATPSTCLMIVMLSVLLVSLPNIRLSQMSKKELSTEQEQITISRSLLSTQKVEDDGLNMEEFFIFNKDDEGVDNENNTENEFFKAIEEMESKYENMNFEKDNSDDNFFNSLVRNIKNLFNKNELGSYFDSDYGGFHNKKGFIEPDIDDLDSASVGVDHEPPAKKMKLIDEHYHQNDENFVPLGKKVIATTVHTSAVGESKDK